jgi:BirA family biotin operon repressor/biotin-[acetyl-CoA-carboxylase] ligase
LIYTSFDNTGLLKVLSFLKSHELEYLSGQDLSDVLKISRVAVWKHIKKIRALGYKIESKQKRGYRFMKTTDQLLPWELTSKIKTNYIGNRIYYFEETDSTQNFALQIAQNKKENGTIIIAQKQTHGKGRLNRKWISPKGGIWFSIILHPTFTIEESMLLPIVSSISLSNAIHKSLNLKTTVKWPNDVTLNGKKVAGMLIDASFQSNTIENIVLGIGINYKINKKELENKIKKSSNFYGVETLLNQSEDENPINLVKNFLHELENNIERLTNGKKAKILNEWTKNSETIHENVIVNTSNGKISGIAKKIEVDGSLIVKTRHGIKRIFVGDVIVK